MKAFGYLETGPADSEALYSSSAIVEAIQKVQKFGGLSQTGELDDKTMKVKIFCYNCGLRRFRKCLLIVIATQKPSMRK